MKRAVLIHGKNGSPDTGWLPWIKQQLELHGYAVQAPIFPSQDDSRLAEWFLTLNTLSVNTLPDTTFIAHARGAMALLRWINTLPPITRIHQVITVSCNFDYQPKRTDGDEFYASRLNYVDLKRKCPNFVVVHSKDDPYVPIEAGQQLASNINAKFAQYKTAGHFGSEKNEAPEILQEIE